MAKKGGSIEAHRALILASVPRDGSPVSNAALLREVSDKASSAFDAEAFESARQGLIDQGLLLKGKGRGGSVRRAAAAAGVVSEAPDDFALEPSVPPASSPLATTSAGGGKARTRQSNKATTDTAQVLSYRHADRRKNNPEVGLVSEASDPEQPKREWAHNPHLDPVLNFDSARADLENLIDEALAVGSDHVQQQIGEIVAWLDHALAGSNEAAVREVVGNLRQRLIRGAPPAPERAALEEIKRRGSPYLQWAGKAERTSFEVDTVSLHVHERIDPMSILAAVRKRLGEAVEKGDKKVNGAQPSSLSRQASLFEAPFESLPFRDAVDFYRHDKGWANRLIAGDSLLVMNSLLVKEGMAGQVQMIYIDPPYGIKYGSNFQPFVGKRDVKDRSDADLTQEPEMIKAFRDTWELGVHSYLTYMRDRLILSRELLAESGSVFVQISDDNVHHIRELMDEVLGAENFIAEICFRTTSSLGGGHIGKNFDFVVWYGKDASKTRSSKLYRDRGYEDDIGGRYSRIELADRARRVMSKKEREDVSMLPSGSRIYRHDNLTSQSGTDISSYEVTLHNSTFTPGKGYWKTNTVGMRRLLKARRIAAPTANSIAYVRFLDDFPLSEHSTTWTDTQTGAFTDEKIYVVQTNLKVIERCMLMTTSPGDLVLDPTCGSGSTAVAAEKWGRRWVTCDTSRVAITLAKQRLMTASFDYYELAYPHEGIRGGFIYKTVPHITLKSIANNPEIDTIYDRLHPAIDDALERLNIVLSKHPTLLGYVSPEGFRKGKSLNFGSPEFDSLAEWEVPAAMPPDWPEAARDAFDAFHFARQRMQTELDRSIAANAERETLFDKPEPSKTKLRVTGPFTVEAVPFPTVLSLETAEEGAAAGPAEDQAYQASIARSGETSRQQQWRDELLKTGIRGRGGQMLRFAELEVLAGTSCLHATGTLADSGERVVVSFGPEHGALEQRQVEHAIGEAGELFPRPKMIVFCAFTFDPEAAKDIDAVKGIMALKAQMNTDLLTEDLKKARSSNQSFWLMGQPEVRATKLPDGQWQVEVMGFDYFDTVKGELISGGKAKIAMWSLDTDYDGRSLFPHQVFFPMAGKDEGWRKLKKSIKAELDEPLLDQFHGTVSLPFEAGRNGKAAVKIVDDRGIESLKILLLVSGAAEASA